MLRPDRRNAGTPERQTC